jgi:hypothetical protein
MTPIDEKGKFWAGSWWIMAYYLGSFLIVLLGEKLAPSGGHSPGLGGIYAIALFPLITLVLVIGSLVSDFDRASLSGRTLVHIVGTILFITWLAKYF